MKEELGLADLQLDHEKTLTLSQDEFVRYCRQRGVNISETLLEEFEKTGLVYPLVRVFCPIEKFTKRKLPNGDSDYVRLRLNERPRGSVYFGLLGISHYQPASNSNTAEMRSIHSTEQCELELPMEVPFQEWKSYKRSKLRFAIQRAKLGRPAIAYYSPLQLLLVLYAMRLKRFPTVDEAVIKKELAKELAEIKFFDQLAQLTSRIQTQARVRQQKQVGLYPEDFSSGDANEILRKCKADHVPELKSIMKERGVTIETMCDLARQIVMRGLSCDPASQVRTLLMQYVPKEELQKINGPMLLAQDYYAIAELLLSFAKILKPSIMDVHGVLNALQGKKAPICVICNLPFQVTRKGGQQQRTCSTECGRTYNTKDVAMKRMLGVYSVKSKKS